MNDKNKMGGEPSAQNAKEARGSRILGFLGGEGFSSASLTALFLAVTVVINIIFYIVVEMFGLYLYETNTDDLSLSGNTDVLFAEELERARVDGNKVKITFFLPEEDVKYHDTGHFVYTTAKNFEERYPELIELDYINIITKRNDRGELVEDLDKYKKDMNGNDTVITKGTMIFEYGSNYRVVTDTYTTAGYGSFFTLDSEGVATAYNGEEVMAGMIKWVLSDEHKTAYFTQFHGEIADLSLSNLFGSAGYYVDVIDLRKDEIPDDASVLVISNPTADLERSAEGSGVRSEMDRIEDYMERGGSLLVTLDPHVKRLPVLEAFLKEWGISFSVTETDSGSTVRNMIKDSRNAITTDGFTLVLDYAKNAVADKIFSRVQQYGAGKNVIISNVAALELSGDAVPLLISSPSSVTEAAGGVISRDGSFAAAAVAEKSYSEENVGRVFVMSSMYLAASDALVTDGYSNRDFIYSVLGDFFGDGEMPYGSNVVLTDTATLRNLKLGTARAYTVFLMAIPVAIAAVGTVITVRRRNR